MCQVGHLSCMGYVGHLVGKSMLLHRVDKWVSPPGSELGRILVGSSASMVDDPGDYHQLQG